MSDPDNPYRTPEAELVEPTGHRGGSIENTLDGRAELEIGAVMSEAWDLVSGFKGIIVLAGVAFVLVGLLVAGVLQIVFSEFVAQTLSTLLMYPLFAGIFMCGLRRSIELPVDSGELVAYYDQFLTIAAIGFLQSMLTMIGFVLLVVPGVYLSIALSLAIPLHVEKGLGVVDSLMTSMRIINREFLSVGVLAIVTSFVIFFSAFTLVGLVWAAPWGVLVYAITYRQLAGASFEE